MSEPSAGKAHESHTPERSLRALISVLIALPIVATGYWTLVLENEKRRLIRVLILLLCTIFLLANAVLFLSVIVIVAFWDSHRLAAIGAVILFYILAGALAFWGLRHALKRKIGLS